jgi:hypothetical protein
MNFGMAYPAPSGLVLRIRIPSQGFTLGSITAAPLALDGPNRIDTDPVDVPSSVLSVFSVVKNPEIVNNREWCQGE